MPIEKSADLGRMTREWRGIKWAYESYPCSPVFKGGDLKIESPVSQGWSHLIGTQTSCLGHVTFYLFSLPSPLPVTISYLQRILYRHSSTSAIKTCFWREFWFMGRNVSLKAYVELIFFCISFKLSIESVHAWDSNPCSQCCSWHYSLS